MADELNIPTHRWYQKRNHIALAKEDVSRQYIFDSGIQKIDAWINSQPWGSPILALFANDEPGVWYDPSDLTTLFQDDAGTTPVTAAGQTVGLMLDKSQGLTLGPELWVTPTISDPAVWTWDGTTLTCTGDGTSDTARGNPVNANSFYRISFTVGPTGSGLFQVRVGNTFIATLTGGANQTYSYFTKAADTTGMTFTDSGGATAVISNISVKELPGYHATQPTAAARPTYGYHPEGGVRNLLIETENFADAVWSLANTNGAGLTPVVTPNAGAAPDGRLVADRVVFSLNDGTATGDISRKLQSARPAEVNERHTVSFAVRSFDGISNYSMTLVTPDGFTFNIQVTGSWQTFPYTNAVPLSVGGTPGIGIGLRGGQVNTNSNVADVLIAEANFEPGLSVNDYQRVGNEYDVTEAGVPLVHYLAFDGVDDFMVTPTITPGIDKAQVFAGVRKLSDANQAAFLELSDNSQISSGSFHIFAPTLDSSPSYRFFSRGTSNAPAATTDYAAPITNAVTALGDISGDLSTLRIDGTQVVENNADQGTGNYLAYPMYIGARAGTSLPFNGNIYSLVTRFGANLETATIEQVETYTAGQTGVTLA